MIVDSHCHAWERWPYDPTVPDLLTRGSVESLLQTFADNGVEHGLIVAANIGAAGTASDNSHNNDYVRAAAAAHPEMLSWVADVDSHWSATHHTPGAADRLESSVEGAQGFTHYVTGSDDGWFDSADGRDFFGRAEQLGLLASLHARPPWYAAVSGAAAAHPALTVLLHHQGHATSADDVDSLIALGSWPNVCVKLSGPRYVSKQGFPYADAAQRLPRIVDAFGPDRLVWGSDAPVSTADITYRQSRELIENALGHLDQRERDHVMGGTMARILRLDATHG